jgi:ABC-type transporter Mla subunit MlaD
MQTRQLVIFVALCLLAAVVVVVAVTAYQRSRSQAVIDAPAVHIETNKATGRTSVDAPFAHVEKDKNGTAVEAPGVKVEVPKSPSE